MWRLNIKQSSYKRPFDITVLLVAHLVLLPLWVALWAIIPILIWGGDRGSVFFKQVRSGKNGKHFTLLKFRTMVPGAEMLGPKWTTDNDDRITPIGRILRRTAMDELPGLINILKGDMSLVGPRALDIHEQKLLEEQISGFEERLQVLPGLTGLAQVNDKYDVALDKLRYDLEYISRMSVWLDINILFISVKNTILARWDHRRGKYSR